MIKITPVVASGGNDKTIRVWDLKGNQVLQEPIKDHKGAINSVAFSQDGNLIASASDDGTVKTWDLKGNLQSNFTGHKSEVLQVDFLPPEGKTLVSTGAKRNWDSQSFCRTLMEIPWVNH